MGRELARRLVAEGCNVAMCDVSIEAHLQRFRDEMIEQQAADKIHLLLNNGRLAAGIASGDTPGPG